MLATNPLVWTTVNSAYDQAARVLAIIWQGQTAAGDTVQLTYQGAKGGVLWTGRANDTQTYLGLNLGEAGMAAPGGFVLTQISSGTVLVYLRED
jgi:hypothetical protein